MSGPGLCQSVERFHFERIFDVKVIKSVITHPVIWAGATDDFCPTPEAWEPPDPQLCWYVSASEAGNMFAIWTFLQQNAICWEVHTCLLPQGYGRLGRDAANALADWIFANTPCQRIVTTVPEYNRLALKFAKAAGMTEYGFNPQSYQKDGKLWGQHLLGISKGNPSCQS